MKPLQEEHKISLIVEQNADNQTLTICYWKASVMWQVRICFNHDALLAQPNHIFLFLFNMFINCRVISLVNYFWIERMVNYWTSHATTYETPSFLCKTINVGTTQMGSRNPKFSEYAKVNFKIKIYIDSLTTPSPKFGDSGYSWNIKINNPCMLMLHIYRLDTIKGTVKTMGDLRLISNGGL